MKTFNRQAAQGDVLITRVANIPANARKENAINGRYIIAHSETGHSHVVAERPGITLWQSENPAIAYLEIIDSVETTLEHERTFDTHESILLKGGTYEVRRQQEYTPEGWRRVAD